MIHQACSFEPEYFDLLAAVTAGEAELVYEQYLSTYIKCIAVKPTKRSNPQIGYSARKFKMILQDYSDWRKAWWREVIQNAVDAGATKVNLDVREPSDEDRSDYSYFSTLPSLAHLGAIDLTKTKIVRCIDDGGGMSDDVLFNKFLMMGGTGKEGVTGAVGGFGVAKELILLPWIVWSVRTQNKLVVGRGLDYEILEKPFYPGTIIEVVMPSDCHTPPYQARYVIDKSYLPGVEFTVSEGPRSEQVVADFKGDTFVKDVPGGTAKITHKKTAYTRSEVIVRVVGPRGALFMFGENVGISLPGDFIADIDGALTTKYLTTNRDSFSKEGQALKNVINEIVAEAAKDVLSFKRKFSDTFKRVYEGSATDRFTTKQIQAKALEELAELPKLQTEEIKYKLGTLTEDAARIAAEEAVAIADRHGKLLNNYIPMPARSETVAGAFEAALSEGLNTVEVMTKQLMWRPYFILINEKQGYVPPADFYPEFMSTRAVRLLRVWGELCRFALISLGYEGTYGIGFQFSDSTGAAYVTDSTGDVTDFLVINPLKVDIKKGGQTTKMLDPKKDLDWLWAAAIHEVTHMVDGISYHDESFAAALTNNIAKTRRFFKHAKAIVDGIKLEGGLSAAEAKKVTAAMRRETLKAQREEIRAIYARQGILPPHDYTPSPKGRWSADKACMICGFKRDKHA